LRKTNFDIYLERQLQDPEFAQRYRKAGEAWDKALNIAALREQAGLTRKEQPKGSGRDNNKPGNTRQKN
jgi:hypothetical protein